MEYNKAKYESLSCISYGDGENYNHFVILLHGYGSNFEDLIAISPLFKNIQNTLFIAPNAPYDCDTGFGRQWFPLVTVNGSVEISNANDIKIASNILSQLIEEIQYYHDIEPHQISLFGFSQGGILALNHSLNSPFILNSIISHSGAYYDDGGQNYNIKQNILNIHGDLDNIISLDKFHKSMNQLDKYNIRFNTHVETGLSHGVNQNTINIAEKFIQNNQKK